MENMAAEVRIVGAGIAGLSCARVVAGAGHRVAVHESSGQVGGRMASRFLGGRQVDLGASYLTCREDAFRTQVDEWVRRGVAHPWTSVFAVQNRMGRTTTENGPVRYGAAGGMRSLVEDLATGIDVALDDEVVRVGPGPTIDGRRADAVVLALPDPQAHRLLDPACAAERAATEGRPWSPVVALAAGWATRSWDVDGVFVHDDPIVEWIADDGRRRADLAPVLVAHSSSDFAANHLDDADAEIALVDAVRSILAINSPPDWTFVQRWPYARPSGPRAVPFHLGEANIGICGDAWGVPRVENAWISGHRLGHELIRRLG
jgi:renalase